MWTLFALHELACAIEADASVLAGSKRNDFWILKTTNAQVAVLEHNLFKYTHQLTGMQYFRWLHDCVWLNMFYLLGLLN